MGSVCVALNQRYGGEGESKMALNGSFLSSVQIQKGSDGEDYWSYAAFLYRTVSVGNARSHV